MSRRNKNRCIRKYFEQILHNQMSISFEAMSSDLFEHKVFAKFSTYETGTCRNKSLR